MSDNVVRRHAVRVAAVAGAAGLTLAAGAVAAGPAGATPLADTATIRSAHFSPDAPGVDVYLTAFRGGTTRLWTPDEKYGTVSNYVRVAAGQYAVSMRKHGASSTSPAILSWNLNAEAGKAYTAAAVGHASKLTGLVLKDDLTAPSAGKGRVRLIQASSRAPKATVTATDGPVIAQNAAFPTSTGYAQVPAGTWPLQAKAVSGSLSTTADVSVAAGSVTSLLLLDSQNGKGITLKSVTDSASAAVMPKGSVPAGGGGMAPNAAPSASVLPAVSAAGAGAAIVIAALFAFVPRRRRAQQRVK